MQQTTVFIEAQRLFRKQKHGMDVVALELLHRLRKAHPKFNLNVLVKEDEDHCLHKSPTLSVKTLRSAFYPLWEQWTLPKWTREHKNSILHCTGNTAPLWSKTPLVVTIHDLIFLEDNYLLKKDGGSLYQRFGNYYRRLIVPRVARKARHIVTVSSFQRELIMQRLQIAGDKISVVYNGVDERFFESGTAASIRSVLQAYDIHSPYIFFLGNTEPRKNTSGVIEAFASFCKNFPQYKHKLVIKGLSEDQLKKRIDACGAGEWSHRIKLVGYIQYRDLPLLYQGADVLWFPSFSEGFGLPIVEAMASGTPVITSALSVMPEIAGEAALYINPAKPEELAAQTNKLFSDQAMRSNLIKKGKDRAARFTWDQSAKDLLKIYDKVLQEEHQTGVKK